MVSFSPCPFISRFESSTSDIKTSLNLNDGPYPIHQLDKVGVPYLSCCARWIILAKGTTGCLLIALTPKAAKSLSTQFHEKDVYKSYWAIVCGRFKPPRTSGVIDDPILYTDGSCTLNRAAGKPSLTEWELIESSVSRRYLLLSQLL